MVIDEESLLERGFASGVHPIPREKGQESNTSMNSAFLTSTNVSALSLLDRISEDQQMRPMIEGLTAFERIEVAEIFYRISETMYRERSLAEPFKTAIGEIIPQHLTIRFKTITGFYITECLACLKSVSL